MFAEFSSSNSFREEVCKSSKKKKKNLMFCSKNVRFELAGSQVCYMV